LNILFDRYQAMLRATPDPLTPENWSTLNALFPYLQFDEIARIVDLPAIVLRMYQVMSTTTTFVPAELSGPRFSEKVDALSDRLATLRLDQLVAVVEKLEWDARKLQEARTTAFDRASLPNNKESP
jgi:hypothetical protein